MQFFKMFAAAALIAVPTSAVLAKADATTAKEKKICRAQEDTGSRVARHRICMTMAEWANEDRSRARDAERAVDSTQDRTGNAIPVPGPR
jgi:hypothetical protein